MVHGMNSNYGHRAILATAADVDSELPILGVLQHGWTPYDGWARYHKMAPNVRRFVWSSKARGRRPVGRSGAPYVAIGSPFAYMAQAAGFDLLKPSIGSATIAFPQHSAENVEVDGGHVAYAEHLRDRGGSTTVCLYWLDYADERVRRAYAAAGHTVTTIGTTRNDRYYLARFLRILDGNHRVVSNRVSTALLYASAIGLRAEVSGLPFPVTGVTERGTEEAADSLALLRAETGQADNIPEEWARAELGWGETLEPAALAKALGWGRGRRVWGSSVMTASLIARAVRPRGYR